MTGTRFIYLVLLSIYLLSCLSAKPGKYRHISNNDSVIVVHDTIDNPEYLIDREIKDSLYLLFRGNFEDTMSIKFNDVKIGRYPIYRKDYRYPTRSDDSDIYVGLLRKPGKNTICLELTGKHHVAEFKVPYGYPICLIEYYNEKWTIKFRKHIVMSPVVIIRR
jgi:hypothetical protein